MALVTALTCGFLKCWPSGVVTMLKAIVAAAGFLLFACATAARADSVASLNTGQAADGSLLPSGALDSRYQLLSAPSSFPLPQSMYVAAPVNMGSSYSALAANTSDSQWIAPSTGENIARARR
jgi:hypothetical protein